MSINSRLMYSAAMSMKVTMAIQNPLTPDWRTTSFPAPRPSKAT